MGDELVIGLRETIVTACLRMLVFVHDLLPER
jgi:hypothetical protein